MNSILLAVVILTSICYVILPYLKNNTIFQNSILSKPNNTIDLYKRYEATLSIIKDLEFDYKTGKMSSENFNEMKNQYRQKAIAIFKKIEVLEQQKNVKQKFESELDRLPENQKNDSVKFCSNCGASVSADDNYCKNCGINLRFNDAGMSKQNRQGYGDEN